MFNLSISNNMGILVLQLKRSAQQTSGFLEIARLPRGLKPIVWVEDLSDTNHSLAIDADGRIIISVPQSYSGSGFLSVKTLPFFIKR